MTLTVLMTVAANEVEQGDYISVAGIVEGRVLDVEDNGEDVVLVIQDEDECGDIARHTVDAFESVDILGY